MDVRADGRIAVLPPSLGYRWIADDVGAFPPMWLAAIRGEGKPVPRPRRPPAPRDGVDVEELERINNALVTPPLPDREIQTIARSAARGTR